MLPLTSSGEFLGTFMGDLLSRSSQGRGVGFLTMTIGIWSSEVTHDLGHKVRDGLGKHAPDLGCVRPNWPGQEVSVWRSAPFSYRSPTLTPKP